MNGCVLLPVWRNRLSLWRKHVRKRRQLTELTIDLHQAPPESQPCICSLLVILAVPSAFSFRGQWQPRHKEAMGLLSHTAPDLHRAIDGALRAHSAEAYRDLQSRIRTLLEPVGGWAGPPIEFTQGEWRP